MFNEHFFKASATAFHASFNKERGSFSPGDGRWGHQVTTERQRIGKRLFEVERHGRNVPRPRDMTYNRSGDFGAGGKVA
jgi:hypothetical protein